MIQDAKNRRPLHGVGSYVNSRSTVPYRTVRYHCLLNFSESSDHRPSTAAAAECRHTDRARFESLRISPI